VCTHLTLVFYRMISVSIWVQAFHNLSGQSRFELAVTMSRRNEAIEKLRGSMPGPSCKSVRTILDTRGNAMSIKDSRAASCNNGFCAATASAQQYSVLPALGIDEIPQHHDPNSSSYSSHFHNEIFEGAIRRYLFNVYCRKLSPLFT
jgi:hypothetical protein